MKKSISFWCNRLKLHPSWLYKKAKVLNVPYKDGMTYEEFIKFKTATRCVKLGKKRTVDWYTRLKDIGYVLLEVHRGKFLVECPICHLPMTIYPPTVYNKQIRKCRDCYRRSL